MHLAWLKLYISLLWTILLHIYGRYPYKIKHNRKWDKFAFLLEFLELKERAHYLQVQSNFVLCCPSTWTVLCAIQICITVQAKSLLFYTIPVSQHLTSLLWAMAQRTPMSPPFKLHLLLFKEGQRGEFLDFFLQNKKQHLTQKILRSM